MSFICRRCNRITKQELYRVISENAGVVMLNMLVCASCARLAKNLGLATIRIESEKQAEKKNTESVITDVKRPPIQP